MEQVAGHVWEPIELSWSQRLAAFWAITWPTHLTLLVLAIVPAAMFSGELTKSHRILVQVLVLVVYPFCQILWVPRLVEKRFSSFRIFAEYADGTTPKYLPIRHSLPPTICVMVPQIGFMAVVWLIVFLLAHSLDKKTFQSINSAVVWLRILVVGPYSISFALTTNYPRFRFRAYASRIAPS